MTEAQQFASLMSETRGSTHQIQWNKKRNKWVIAFPQQRSGNRKLVMESDTLEGLLISASDWVLKHSEQRSVRVVSTQP